MASGPLNAGLKQQSGAACLLGVFGANTGFFLEQYFGQFLTARSLYTTKLYKELLQQLDALPGIGVAPFGQDTPEKRKGDAVVDG